MARGPGYLESDNLGVYDAATSYFLALTGLHTFRWRLGRLYIGESLTIVRTLGLHKSQEQTYTRLGTLPAAMGSHGADHEGSREQGVDNITLEIGRRVFWTMFVSIKSTQQLGAAFEELVIPPPTLSKPYPPLPAEVDDFCIYPTHNEPQPPGLLPMIAGFNANVRVFRSYDPLSTMEMACGIDAVGDWKREKGFLHGCLRRCKDSTRQLPRQLTVYPGSTPVNAEDLSSRHGYFAQHHLSKDPASSLMSPSHRSDADQTPQQRRDVQYEIQKANIYASSLSTRVYVVGEYWKLCEARSRSTANSHPNCPDTGITAAGGDGLVPQAPPTNPDMIDQEMRQERESVVKDLLVVLSSIDEVNMEPNADGFVSVLPPPTLVNTC